MFTSRVVSTRVGPFGYAEAFSDVALGYENGEGEFIGLLVVKGVALRLKKDKKSFWVQFPQKMRVDKTGNPQLNKEGFKQFDSILDLYFSGEGDERQAAPEAWEFKENLLKQVLASVKEEKDKNGGRGAAAAPRKVVPPKPAAPKAKRPADADEMLDEADNSDGDEELPF